MKKKWILAIVILAELAVFGYFVWDFFTTPKQGFTKTIMLPGNVPLEMVYIEPGTFMMGSPESEKGHLDYETQHQVTLTQGFWLGKYEVTQVQWLAVMWTTPSYFNGSWQNPVETVSWEDAQAFCQKAGNGLRLPTEAEWEYACRAGSTKAYCFGDDASKLGTYAWYRYTSSGGPHPVGQKQANAWGLYDMHGNVWEWCQDGWYGGYMESPSASLRVVRGGYWRDGAEYCRSASRDCNYPSFRFYSVGFRLALDR